jgi:hypothetical protein
MSNLKNHALLEFKAAGWDLENDEMQKLICDQVLELLELFGNHGHSGSSAPYAINLFKTLASYEPIVPLTGEDWEWIDQSYASGEPMWQNKRCGHVFKGADGRAYDIDGKIFREPNGACYTGRESRVYITFPYSPKSEYVDVPLSAECLPSPLPK